MRLSDGQFVLSATDLSQFLNCRHLTALDMSLALGRRSAPPKRDDPTIDLLKARGQEHEQRYVDRLRANGKVVFDARGEKDEQRDGWIARTAQAMQRGIDVIVQGALGDGQWFGVADIIERVPVRSDLGDWSYEVTDTKLASETKAGTILQLGLYSSLVARIQGIWPESFHVVTPAPGDEVLRETYRVHDYAAYFRLMQRRMLEAIASGDEALGAAHYPDPVEHCGVCRWWRVCKERREADDHSSLVAGISRVQRREFAAHGAHTLTAIARLPEPIPFRPRSGSRQTYERARQQALVQLESKHRDIPLHRLRPVEPTRGLCRLPEPSPGDVFLDLEGDPFVREKGREYLFGIVTHGAGGSPVYRTFWAYDDAEERRAFEAVMDIIGDAWAKHDGMHVYHYSPYEPAAFKRLMGRYAAREQDMDALLRGGRFVDLYAVVRESMFAGVEGYSIKNLEPLFGFARQEDLRLAGRARNDVAYALGAGEPERITEEIRSIIARYNRDDCVSTLRLRDWLEAVRKKAIADGAEIARPQPESGEASRELDEKARRVAELRERLLKGVPEEAKGRSAEQQARWILAYLLDWHRREDRSTWFEYFRLAELAEEDRMDERHAVAGLEFEVRVGPKIGKNGRATGSMIDRYRYPEQLMELAVGDELQAPVDSQENPVAFGRVVGVDRDLCTIDIVKGPKVLDLHPGSVFEFSFVGSKSIEEALFAIGERVAADGEVHVSTGAADRAARDLLLRNPPHLRDRSFDASALAITELHQLPLLLDETVLAVQGPPGSGKTHHGARMICELVAAGKRVGVTAHSHKVIRNFLRAIETAAAERSQVVRMGHKVGEDEHPLSPTIEDMRDNKRPLKALVDGDVQVLGGTAHMWARAEFRSSVDVLVVDEAGQMSLANVVGSAHSASSMVLLGDPQQLDQPTKGSHPDGVEVSALEHLLAGQRTITSDRGVFLDHTWRLAPSICAYTSEVFYESKLHSRAGLEVQRLINAGEFEGSGVFVVGVAHDGNRNSSDEEVEIVASLVARLTAPGVRWVDAKNNSAQLHGENVLVVSPYNAQVNRLLERLEPSGVRVGTVDKFQGQEAPVVIYSMATSRPEDAPRGMEFLYSPNRLNVATSRARCAAILVASPALFEPECRSPRQMQVANGVCRFVEMAAEQPSPS